MSLRCPHCSSVIDGPQESSGSLTCPGCGQIVSNSSLAAQQDETRRHPRLEGRTTTSHDCLAAAVDVPQTLGRYRLLNEVGSGAFGRVYRGYDTELQRTIAIKILKTEHFPQQEDWDQFFDEARVMASIHHPGIVPVHDVGVDQGLHYVVTQFISGGTLHDRLLRGAPSRTETADILRQCAEAIHAAHKLQLYHRDLKPKNILLDQGRAYVADFGLAIRRRDQVDRIGEFAGSASFMSPEQLRGQVHRIDGRTDVWALGVILYLLLTGKLPFQGAASRLVKEVQERDPIPPRQLDETIPRELETICLKCLNKAIEDRYPSAYDLAEDLRRFLAGTSGGELSTVTVLPEVTRPTVIGLEETTVVRRPPPSPWIQRGTILLLAAVVVGLGWFGRYALSPPGTAGSQAASPEKLRDPFDIDSYAIPGRPYSLLETPPAGFLWPRETTPAGPLFDYSTARQDLLLEAPMEAFVGLGKTQSDNFRLRVSLKKLTPGGFAGVFWGFQDLAAPVGRESQCHAFLIQGIPVPKDGWRLELHRSRLTFREKHPENLAATEHSLNSSAVVTVQDAGPYDLDVLIHAGAVSSVKWCGNEVESLREVHLTRQSTYLSARGAFGVAAIDSSVRFSEARVTFSTEASPGTASPQDRQ